MILISPRRFGKTSLIEKVTSQQDRPVIFLDLQLVTDVTDFATQLLKRVLKVNKYEKIKQYIASFKIIPTVELNPMNNNIDIMFKPSTGDSFTPLEDVLNMIEKIGEKGKRPIVVLDEFQEIISFNKNILKQLRSIIQHHKNVNYVFLGSLESMMKTIFETKKSPFYHFGYLMSLKRIPYNDFYQYLSERFEKITNHHKDISTNILDFTACHPYYTQQLAFYCWSFLEQNEYKVNMFSDVINNIIQIHSNDYERLWNTISQTDKKILIALATKNKVNSLPLPTSTVYSGIKRLITKGYLIKTETVQFDDPFFKQWLLTNLL